jgi:hypothetical protein
MAHRCPLCWHPVPLGKSQSADRKQPAEASFRPPPVRATSSRNGGRNHLGTASDIKSDWRATLSRIRGRLPSESAAKHAELDHIERRIRRIVELITDDDARLRALNLKQELVSLEARQLTLQQEVAATESPALLIHPNLSEIYRQRVERLHESLNDPTTRDEAFELIRSLSGYRRRSATHRIGRHPGVPLTARSRVAFRLHGANQDGCGGRI